MESASGMIVSLVNQHNCIDHEVTTVWMPQLPWEFILFEIRQVQHASEDSRKYRRVEDPNFTLYSLNSLFAVPDIAVTEVLC
jgi:hypothetical protein